MTITDEQGNEVVTLEYRRFIIHDRQWSIEPLLSCLDLTRLDEDEYLHIGPMEWDVLVTLTIELLNREYNKECGKTFTLGIDNDKKYRMI